MTLFDLIKQWLAEQPEFEYLSKTRIQYQVILVCFADNPSKIILLMINDNTVTTSKGILNVSNPKFFNLLKKQLIQGLRN